REFGQEFARASQPKNPTRKNHQSERKHQPDNPTAVSQMTIPDARPTGSFNGVNYLRDVVFVRAGAITTPLRIVQIVADLTSGNITLQWEGDGATFQVEKAASLTGTFQPVGPVQTAKVFTDPGVLKTN